MLFRSNCAHKRRFRCLTWNLQKNADIHTHPDFTLTLVQEVLMSYLYHNEKHSITMLQVNCVKTFADIVDRAVQSQGN